MANLKKINKADCDDKAFAFMRIMPHHNTHPPIPRSEHCILATAMHIYVIGGFNRAVFKIDLPHIMDREWSIENPILREIWRFSKLTKTWTYMNATGDRPVELTSHAAVFKNSNTIVIYGGSGYPVGQVLSNKIYKLNLETMHWSQVLPINTRESGHIPEPMYGQMAVMDDKGENLYVSGGKNGEMFNLNVHRFNFKEQKWTRLAAALEGEERYRHTMALWDKKLFIFAGANADITMPMNKILILDLQTNNWMTIDASPFIDTQGNRLFPEGRFGHASAQLGDTVYITGGKSFTDYFSDFWLLHLPSLTWTMHRSKLPYSLSYHSMAIDEKGELTIFGGIVTKYCTQWPIDLVYRTWVKIPSLERMAMEATVVANQKILNQHPGRNGYVQHVTPRLLADYINEKPIQGIRANPKKLDLPDN